MKPLLISSTDTMGGAAIASKRTLKALQLNTVNARMFVQLKFSKDRHIIKSDRQLLGYFRFAIDKFLAKLVGDIWSTSVLPSFNTKQILKERPDIINLHWFNNTLSINDLLKFKKYNIPLVWTLHDMWAFLGGFHYTSNKSSFLDKLLYNYKNNKLKQLKSSMTIVTPSNWLAKEAKKSEILKGFDIRVIPNGIDTQLFKPIPNAKEKLKLNSQKKYLLFGAVNSLKDKRKGSDLLYQALKHIPEDIELLIFGATESPLQFKQNVHYLGNIKDETQLATIYSAADVFIAPSRQDNLPNTVLESMACATPVVAFNIGGMPDMITKKTGALASPFNIKDLAKKISSVLKHPEYGKNARELMQKKFNAKLNSKAYIKLYEELLKK